MTTALGALPIDGSFGDRHLPFFQGSHQPNWQMSDGRWKCTGCHLRHELPLTGNAKPTDCIINEDGK